MQPALGNGYNGFIIRAHTHWSACKGKPTAYGIHLIQVNVHVHVHVHVHHGAFLLSLLNDTIDCAVLRTMCADNNADL